MAHRRTNTTTSIDSGIDYATGLIAPICEVAGSRMMIGRHDSETRRLGQALLSHDTPALFDWLMNVVSYQGISDEVARGYVERNGNATWGSIATALASTPTCPKLGTYWRFEGCQYNKSALTCAEPAHIASCRLPLFNLRNGRLNQTAFALFLFIRDIAGGDLVRWIDEQIRSAADGPSHDPYALHRAALIEPLTEIYGVSDKVLSMALSTLLLAAPPRLAGWADVGASMIVVDSLVHNFLHRTGILGRSACQHSYGPACYEAGGCADLLRHLAFRIDAREFNAEYPKVFPRFVQHSIWYYCAQEGLNVCNGVKIDDFKRCCDKNCFIFKDCDRKLLKFDIF